MINDDNKHLCGKDAIDLLEKMLVYDHNVRITPKDALSHPYFADMLGYIPQSKDAGINNVINL
jgi:casein kinase II subunit alpha